MSRPLVNIGVSTGSLGIVGNADYGVSAVVLATPSAPVAGYGVPFSVKTKKQAEAAFAQPGNAAVLTAIAEGFYAEAAEGTELFIVCVVNTNSLAQIAAPAVASPVLNYAGGNVRLLAFVKFPDPAYVVTPVGGFDADVHTGATAAQALADTFLTAKKPFRAFVQGYAFTGAAAATTYAASNLRNVAIVVGSVNDSTQIFTLMVLGRASKEQPQRSIGRIKSGSLAIASSASVKLGATTVENFSDADFDTLDTKRYVFPVRNEIAPGYVVSWDHMLVSATDDFNNLRHGRIVDNAVRIAYKAYYEELKDEIEVDDAGRLEPVVEKALETKIETAIDVLMGGQLASTKGRAAVKALVNPDPVAYASLYAQANISNPNLNVLTNGGTLYMFVRMQPKGCINTINAFLSLTASI